MKKIILPIAICTALFASFAFTGSNACDGNEMFVKGTFSKNGYYKEDGTLTGTGTSTVTDVITNGDSTIATIATSYENAKPKKDEKPHEGSMRMICVDGKIVMDMGGLANGMAPAGNDMKMVITGNMVPYKNSYTAGEKLEDVKMNMQMYNNGNLMMTSDISITDRVCEAVEDRTTPAGTFHCYKISSMSSSDNKMGAMKMPGGKPAKSVQWYSVKAGIVRMENFKDDKMSSYNELIELKKP